MELDQWLLFLGRASGETSKCLVAWNRRSMQAVHTYTFLSFCRTADNCMHAEQVVGDQFGMGIDDTHMKIRGAPVLDEPALSPHQKMIADKLAVSELMSMAVVALPPIVKVLSVALRTPHILAPASTDP